MIAEDVIEEHNGVYGGKWHIVSPEGFDLPEGLEYLKNSWEGSWDDHCMGRKKRIHKYDASIKISNVPLGDAFRKVFLVTKKFRAHETNLEIENCTGNTEEMKQNYLDWAMYYVGNLSMHGCQLTFQDLALVMIRIYRKNNHYDLSNNTIFNKKPDQWKKLKTSLSDISNAKIAFSSFNLQGCNFSADEKENLMHIAGSLNFLI